MFFMNGPPLPQPPEGAHEVVEHLDGEVELADRETHREEDDAVIGTVQEGGHVLCEVKFFL